MRLKWGENPTQSHFPSLRSSFSDSLLAGVMLSETKFRHQVESEIRPFRDVFLGLFFVSFGMMLFLTIILVKVLLITLFSRIAGWSHAVSMRTALILAHGG
ncbi:MAG: cation:proton antiporter [Mariprofundaceae bacterium]|nr:cation:proton antiporter [Mariprofundaceae bacterium]